MSVKASWSVENVWLEIEHDDTLTFYQLMDIKDEWFGPNAECYMVFPARSAVIDNGNYTHLFRWMNMADMC